MRNLISPGLIKKEWYRLANACWLKVATFAGQLEKYEVAFKIFEQVAAKSVENPLTRFSVKDYFLKAALCRLCGQDVLTTQQALTRYTDLDPTFGQTREHQFLQQLCMDVDHADAEKFTETVVEFDQLTKLDPWKTTMLLKLKKNLAEEPELR